MQTNQHKILTKGADSIIFGRRDVNKNPPEVFDLEWFKIMKLFDDHLAEYGKIGLRTLLLAEKNLSQDEFTTWNEKYHKASTLVLV